MGMGLLVEPPSAAAAGTRVSNTNVLSLEVQHCADSVQCPLDLCCWQSEHTHIYIIFMYIRASKL